MARKPISLDVRVAGALYLAAAALVIGSALMHPHVAHTAAGIATVSSSEWASLHTMSAFGYAFAGLGSLLLLGLWSQTPLARVGHAVFAVGGIVMIVGTAIDGGSALLAEEALRGPAAGTYAVIEHIGTQVYTFGFGFLGVGGLVVLASAALSSRGVLRLAFLGGSFGFVLFALAGFVSIGMRADIVFFFFGGVPAFLGLGLHGARMLLGRTSHEPESPAATVA